MNVSISQSWKEQLKSEFEKPYFTELVSFVKGEYAERRCFPPGKMIFNAYDACSYDDIKVVILGQDPYIRPGQAHGLSFSVPAGMDLPPSLKNIYKELDEDMGGPKRTSGDLTPWAKQGVFLLNASLTVREGESGSHQGKGWETFTDATIAALNKHERGLVFMLWGSFAQKKSSLLDSSKHLILKAPHPSPLSAYRGFFGCKHFSQTNEWLSNNGRDVIHW